jgi:hypothetical protein
LPLPTNTKRGRVADAQAFSLDQIFARGGDVNQEIDQMVVEQVDLVDVQKTPVRLGQQAGRKLLDALREGFFQIERAHNAVFCGAQWQVHHADGPGLYL